jgi:tRNA dimethylallyltransferase
VGKSELALALARRTPSEIIIADSMQVYRGLDVGTSKPSAAERRAVPHHLLDVCDPAETFSAFEFASRAGRLAQEIHARGRLAILVGGTGLYLRAFLKGQLSGGGGDPAVRARLHSEAEREGAAALHARLRTIDPVSSDRIRSGDVFRLVRALELWERTGERPSALRPGLWDPPQVPVFAFLVLMRERSELCRMIDARAHRMWEAGLVAEVQALLRAGYSPNLRPLQALGYRQALSVLSERLDETEALAEMQRATRNYAKRQVTWFRREPAAEWIMIAGDDWVEPLTTSILDRLLGMDVRTSGQGPDLSALVPGPAPAVTPGSGRAVP